MVEALDRTDDAPAVTRPSFRAAPPAPSTRRPPPGERPAPAAVTTDTGASHDLEGSHMTRILITGVRGKTGAPLADRLARGGEVEVLGGSSDPSRVTIDGVRPTVFSWDDRSGWPA